MRRTFVFSLTIVLLVSLSCQNNYSPNSSFIANSSKPVVNAKHSIEFIKPINSSKIKVGDNLDISFRPLSDSEKIDSIKIKIDNKFIETIKGKNLETKWNTKNSLLGLVNIQAISFSDKKSDSISTNVILYPGEKSIDYSYRIIKTYPHSRNAYTQGLIFENGFFYESDGEYGKSALRKVKLETGESVKIVSYDRKTFGEGIALFNDQIFQLTWKERTCYVYNKETFELIKKLNYNIEEGWGLEFDGQNFLMTDGSNIIYLMEPESFTQVGKIEVFDENGPVIRLNELELIKGMIYANIYTTDKVVIVEPASGKVLGKIDFSSLLLKSDIEVNTDVLNGIAWDKTTGHLFITGKNWPKLFEIEIIRK
jgi:glutaminyl-peptide cyclotransferase